MNDFRIVLFYDVLIKINNAKFALFIFLSYLCSRNNY